MSLFVGTSGWVYKEWRGGFYPERLPQRAFLEFYGRELSACEVNATFYRVQSAETVERWTAAVPPQFRFALKLHRRLTHRKAFAPDQDAAGFLRRFIASLAPLGQQLGCLLIQFPPFVERDDAALAALLDLLPDRVRFACEFRHPSWETGDVAELIASAGGTVCVPETEGQAASLLPPGPLAYVRLRGARYDEMARARWLELLREESEKRHVYVFAKHEGVAAGDPHAGVGLAQWLVSQTKGSQT